MAKIRERERNLNWYVKWHINWQITLGPPIIYREEVDEGEEDDAVNDLPHLLKQLYIFTKLSI